VQARLRPRRHRHLRQALDQSRDIEAFADPGSGGRHGIQAPVVRVPEDAASVGASELIRKTALLPQLVLLPILRGLLLALVRLLSVVQLELLAAGESLLDLGLLLGAAPLGHQSDQAHHGSDGDTSEATIEGKPL
jgi:hypothetical protein